MASVPSVGVLLWMLLCALVLFLAVGSGVRGNTLCAPFGFCKEAASLQNPRRPISAKLPLQWRQQPLAPAGCLLRDIWVAAAGEDGNIPVEVFPDYDTLGGTRHLLNLSGN